MFSAARLSIQRGESGPNAINDQLTDKREKRSTIQPLEIMERVKGIEPSS